MLDVLVIVSTAVAAAAVLAMLRLVAPSGHRTGWLLSAAAIAAGAAAAYQARTPSLVVQLFVIGAWSLTLGAAIRLRPYFIEAQRTRRELQDERRHAEALLAAAPVLIATFDPQARLLSANAAFCALFGTTEEHLREVDWTGTDVVPASAGTKASESAARKALLGGALACGSDGFAVDAFHTAPDGEERIVSWRATVVCDEGGRPSELILAGDDITEGVRAQRELAFRAYLLDRTADGVIVTSPSGELLYANAAFSEMLGYDGSGMPGLRADAWLHGGLAGTDGMRQLSDGETVETEVRRRDGTLLPVEMQMAALPGNGGGRGVITVRDLTERRRIETELRLAAMRDPLTGFPNRLGFLVEVEVASAHASAAGERVGVLLVGIDHFSPVNDSFGWDVGDAVLVALAERIAAAAPQRSMVGRTGGDEFGVLVVELAEEAVLRSTAESILEAVRAPIILGAIEVDVTASIGIASSQTYADAEEMVVSAAKAQGIAREDGGDSYAAQQTMPATESRDRYSLKTDLRYALARDELAVHYQPIVGANDGRIVGAEALLRWTHPTRGPISPAQTIVLAEESGLIGDIDRWVLDAACEDCGTWRAMGYGDFRVSVNISGRQFSDDTFAEKVRLALDRHGLDGSALELEVTERVVMRDADIVSETFARLEVLGVDVAVDDFGTGHSSLERLKRLPVKTLKVDRSFVQDVCSDEDSAAIATSVIALAHALNMRVIAEGVESAAQLAFLRAHGCDLIQGFLFSAAIPARELGLLLLSR